MKRMREFAAVSILLLLASPALAQIDLAAIEAASRPGREGRFEADAFGTQHSTAIAISAWGFVPLHNNPVTAITPGGGRYLTAGSDFWGTSVSIPTGAIIEGLEIQGCDQSSDAMTVILFRSTVNGTTEPNWVNVIQFDTTGNTSCTYWFDAPGGTLVADSYNNVYSIVVRQTAFDGSQVLQGVRLYYRRQVSAAPVSATFDDVPTTHPLFQYIEALVASGITAGCDVDNFCPNAPLTRGQMAVFLAKALGLHWPF